MGKQTLRLLNISAWHEQLELGMLPSISGGHSAIVGSEQVEVRAIDRVQPYFPKRRTVFLKLDTQGTRKDFWPARNRWIHSRVQVELICAL